jgi:hypothetical protein
LLCGRIQFDTGNERATNQTTNDNNVAGWKIAALVRFFTEMRNRGINPTFMFCDKDSAEITTITNIWGVSCLRLCLWHLNRAVDKHLSAPQRSRRVPSYNIGAAIQEFAFVDSRFLPTIPPQGTHLCNKAKREELGYIMTRHYCWHPLIPHGNNILM